MSMFNYRDCLLSLSHAAHIAFDEGRMDEVEFLIGEMNALACLDFHGVGRYTFRGEICELLNKEDFMEDTDTRHSAKYSIWGFKGSSNGPAGIIEYEGSCIQNAYYDFCEKASKINNAEE